MKNMQLVTRLSYSNAVIVFLIT